MLFNRLCVFIQYIANVQILVYKAYIYNNDDKRITKSNKLCIDR